MDRRAALAGLGLAAAAPVAAQVTQTPTHKNLYFAEQAALLDPAAMVYERGTFNVSVPAGETWYAFNAWYCRSDGVGDHSAFFVRDLFQPMPLPEHSIISGTNEASFLLYARPALVMDDSRYLDGEEFYYERLLRLQRMPMYSIGGYRMQGTVNTAPQSTASFPLGHERVMLTDVSCHDGCWITMGNNDKSRVINTQSEIDDVRGMRFSSTMTFPFMREMFPHIQLGRGVAGNNPQAPQTHTAHFTVMYRSLPVDW